jgi:phage major head subunit gpT-like protein
MLITGSNLQQFFQLVDFSFKSAQVNTPTFWQYLTKRVPSSTEKNVYPWLSEVPGLREWAGQRVINNLATRDYSLTNKSFEDTIGIDRDKLADDTYGFFGDVAGALGKAVTEFPDIKISETLEAGNSTLCWDGQYFFDTDHPVCIDDSTKSTYSNNLVGAAYDLSTDPVGVFDVVRTTMRKFKREDGRPLGITPNILMVPPDWEKAGKIAVQAQVVSQAQMNAAGTEYVGAAGVTNIYQGDVTLIVNEWLTDTDCGYLFCTTRGIMPLIYQERQAANFVPRVAPDSDNVFLQKRFEWGVDLRAAFGYTFPFLACRFAAA